MTDESQTGKLIELLFAFLLPPVAVLMHGGHDMKMHFVLSILLLIMVWLPSVLHALWYCFIRDRPTHETL